MDRLPTEWQAAIALTAVGTVAGVGSPPVDETLLSSDRIGTTASPSGAP